MISKISIKQSVVAAGLATVLAAGCTAPVESSSSSEKIAAAKTLDFSYDTTVDQLTHMSCTNMPMSSPLGFNGSAYFTYRMGAYRNGGITLTNAFYNKLKPYTFDSQSEILSSSKANSNTVLQLALRSRENRQAIKVRSGTTAVAGQDYANMFTTLGQGDVSQSLVQNPVNARIHHLRNGLVGGYLLEGTLYFTQGAATVQDVRDFAQGIGATGAGMLAVTYTNGTEFSARSAADVVAGSTVNKAVSVYGRGYIPSFSQPARTGQYAGYPRNTLTTVTETSLDGSVLSPAPVWTCPVSMQLKIVRPEDASTVGCVRQSDPQTASGLMTTDLLAQLKIVRNTLKVEDWYVDIVNHCAIPKHSGQGCYGPVTAVMYAPGDACGTDGAGNSNCVQYASTCYRN